MEGVSDALPWGVVLVRSASGSCSLKVLFGGSVEDTWNYGYRPLSCLLGQSIWHISAPLELEMVEGGGLFAPVRP